MYQTEIVSLNDLVSEQHMYRKFASIWQLKNVESELSKIEEASDHKGYGIFRLFKCLLLQFMEDLSDSVTPGAKMYH